MTTLRADVRIERNNGYWTPRDEVTDEQIVDAAKQLPNLAVDPANIASTHVVRSVYQDERAADFTYGSRISYWDWHPGAAKKQRLYDFTLVNPGIAGNTAHVYMDGEELKGVKKVVIDTEADQPNLITITFLAGSINKEDK